MIVFGYVHPPTANQLPTDRQPIIDRLSTVKPTAHQPTANHPAPPGELLIGTRIDNFTSVDMKIFSICTPDRCIVRDEVTDGL